MWDPLHVERGGKLAEQRLGVHCSALFGPSERNAAVDGKMEMAARD